MQYYSIKVYILILIPIDLDPPKLVHRLISSFAILGCCIENESRILINLTIITYQENLIKVYGHYYTCANNYLDANILQYICEMSLFLNIDKTSNKSLFELIGNMLPSRFLK